MNLQQTQYPFDENQDKKSYGLLMPILLSFAFIGLCFFIHEQMNESEDN